MTVSEAIDIALAEMQEELSATSMPTWRSHARAAKKYWGADRDLRTITRLQLQAWINWRAKTGVKPSTIGHELCLISHLWRVLEDRGMDEGLSCPLHRLRKPKNRGDKRQIESKVVLELAKRLRPEDFDLVDFAQLTFLRPLEIFRLIAEHIKLWQVGVGADGQPIYEGTLHVVTSKTGRSRKIPLNWQAAAIIKRRLDLAEANGWTYLFGRQNEDRFQAACHWSKTVWRPIVKAIGCGGQFHGLRHRGAHTAWANKAAIETISKMLGHRSIVQTEHYIGVTEEAMWEAANAACTQPAPVAVPVPLAPEPEPERQPEPPKAEPQPVTEEPVRRPRATDWIFEM